MSDARASHSGSLRVAFLTGQLDWGGAERQLFLAARALAAGGDAVGVACLSDRLDPYGPRLEELGVVVGAFPRRGHWDLLRVLALRRWIGGFRPDVLLAFGEFASVYGWAARLGPRPRPALVAMLRRSAMELRGAKRWLVRRAFVGAEVACANSDAGRRYGETTLGIPPGKITIVRNALPPEVFETRGDRRGLAEQLGLDASVPWVVYVGRRASAKDLPTLGVAASRLERIAPAARILLVGEGLEDGAALAPSPASNLVPLGVRRDAVKIVAASDLLVLSSRSEGTPNVVLEAMAVGKAVVSTRVGDLDSLIASPDAGLLVEPGDGEGLADAIAVLLADPTRREAMGARGNAFARLHFSIEASVEGLRRQALRAVALANSGAPITTP